MAFGSVTRARLAVVGGLVGAAAVGAVVGSGEIQPQTAIVPLAAVVFGALAVVARVGVAGLVVLLTGAAVDALPGPSVGGATNLAIFLLIPTLFVVARRRLIDIPTVIKVASLLFALWWFVSVGRALSMGAPMRATLSDARDFGFFALLLPLFTAAFQDADLRRRVAIGLGALAAWVATVNVAAALGILPAQGLFAHAYQTSAGEGGVIRLYSTASDLVTVAIPFALAAVLFAKTLAHRAIAAGVFALCLAEVALTLGRVRYAGVALLVGLMLLTWTRGRSFQRVLLFGALGAALFWGATQVGPLQEPLSGLTDRVVSIFSTSSERRALEGGDTAAYRSIYAERIRDSMTTGDWLAGHGFLPSPWYSFAPDANDTLRNSDLGFYNALNTMGLIGVALLFAPIFRALQLAWRYRLAPVTEDKLYAFGCAGFVIYAVSTSATLVTLFSPSGLVMSSVAFSLSLASWPKTAALATADTEPARPTMPEPSVGVPA